MKRRENRPNREPEACVLQNTKTQNHILKNKYKKQVSTSHLQQQRMLSKTGLITFRRSWSRCLNDYEDSYWGFYAWVSWVQYFLKSSSYASWYFLKQKVIC